MIGTSRRPLVKVSTWGVTHLHHQNPYLVAWWSAVFPGFGHYLLNQYIRATFLTLTEVIINTLSHINEAMVYSFCGQFELAKSILHPTWMFGYLIIYLITISDSFRSAHTQNGLHHLAVMEKQKFPVQSIFPCEIQYITPKNPLIAAVYSFFFPGLGQMYVQRFGLAFYGIFWWWIYLTLSKTHSAFMFLVIGHLREANAQLSPHWLLFMPSVIGGAIYHAFITSVEHNRLFRLEQRQHLIRRYSVSTLQIFK